MHRQSRIYWCVSVMILALAAWGIPAWAQPAETGQETKYAGPAKADANGDNQVTFDELKAVRTDLTQEQFNKMDTNSDGVLTQADRPDPAKRREAFMAKLWEADADSNGQISFEELKAKMPNLTQERFNRMDANGDGVITKADHEAARESVMKADANGDKQVSFDELKAVRTQLTQEQFNKMDRNSDGVLTAADVQRPAPSEVKGVEEKAKKTASEDKPAS